MIHPRDPDERYRTMARAGAEIFFHDGLVLAYRRDIELWVPAEWWQRVNREMEAI